MSTRLNFGVVNPITIGKPQAYDWHVWRRDANGDVWLGFFRDDKVAVEWAKTQPFDCTINNVPPPTSRRYITGGYTWGALAGEQPTVPRWKEQVASALPGRKAAKVVARKPLPNPFRKPAETAEQKRLKASAAKRLDTIKSDEAKDIAEGKTEVH